ncbi:hypothetical protein AB0L81_44270, partial [Streptomyces sp. NPDC052127]
RRRSAEAARATPGTPDAPHAFRTPHSAPAHTQHAPRATCGALRIFHASGRAPCAERLKAPAGDRWGST